MTLLVFAASLSASAANVVKLELRSNMQSIENGAWVGWATYDIMDLRVVATWDDGKTDPDCKRAGKAPVWKTNYGWFEGPKKGADRLMMRVAPPNDRNAKWEGQEALWSTAFGAEGKGTISVRYGGKTAEIAVHARKPTATGKPRLPADYFTEALLPKSDELQPVGNLAKLIIMPKLGARGTEAARFTRLNPSARDRQHARISQYAKRLSDRLEAFVREWLKGPRDEQDVPKGLLPRSIHNRKTEWVICRPENVTIEEQWGIRPAMGIPEDFSELYFLAPDPHCTYGKLLHIAPYGSTLVLEGEFPHCRFFDLQASQPFDSRNVSTVGGIGGAEVPIVDADIEPLEGHANPFRVGANRKAKKRSYRVFFKMSAGNMVELNEALNPGSATEHGRPAYRSIGSKNNTRIAGPFRPSGPLGNWHLIPSVIWLRYYAPDKKEGPLCGVPMPKAHLCLSTGEKYWLKPKDIRLFVRRQNVPVPAYPTESMEPQKLYDSRFGWTKHFGIPLSGMETLIYSLTWRFPDGRRANDMKERLRSLDNVLQSRGAKAKPPGNYEASATCCNYITYTNRRGTCGEGHVLVLTGKLPKTPKTRDGEAVMTKGEMRYFSITRYLFVHGKLIGRDRESLYGLTCYGSIMDDDFVVPDKGPNADWFILAWSRKKDRPKNASAENGVTWRDWGPSSRLGICVRWLSVMPEWHAPKWAPDGNNLSWAKASSSEAGFDPNLLQRNRRKGSFMGDHHIIVHYMTKEQFEALGAELDARNLPHSSGW